MAGILITGAGGFVGRGLAAALAASGERLTLATRRPDQLTPGPDARLVVPGEIGPATDWSAALADVGTVVHLAAHVHVAPERAEHEASLFDDVNHLGALGLYEASRRAAVELFVFVSTINVLGQETRRGAPFDDASVPAPQGPYARSKLAAETALAKAARSGGPRLVILRPPLIVGPGVGGNLGALARLAATPLPLPLGAVANRRTLVARDNLVSAIACVIAHGRTGERVDTFAVGDAEPLSTGDIVRHLREGMGRRPGLVRVPVGAMRFLASVAGRSGLERRLLGDLEVDSSRFRRHFGWTDAVTTADALREVGREAARP